MFDMFLDAFYLPNQQEMVSWSKAWGQGKELATIPYLVWYLSDKMLPLQQGTPSLKRYSQPSYREWDSEYGAFLTKRSTKEGK